MPVGGVSTTSRARERPSAHEKGDKRMTASIETATIGATALLTLDQKIAALVDATGPMQAELQTTLRTLRLARDYDAVLNQLSGASLVLMRQIFQATGLAEPSDNACDCIEIAHKAKLLEPEFYSSLHHIRVWSNRVDHRRLSIKPSQELAEGQLAALLLVTEWFFTESELNPHRLDTLYRLEAATPPLLASCEVSPARRQRLARLFVTPRNYAVAEKLLEAKRFLWILGPPGVGKHTPALTLALRSTPTPVYDLPNTMRWMEVKDTGLSHALLVLPDALDTERFEDEGLQRDWYHLEELAKRGNRIILTTSEERYTAARAELGEQLDSRECGECHMDWASFRLEARETLYRHTVSDAADAGILSGPQHGLALSL